MVIKWDRPNEDEQKRGYVAIMLERGVSSEGLSYTNRFGYRVQTMNRRVKRGGSLPYWITPSKNTGALINIHNAPDSWQDNPEFVYIGRYNSRYRLDRSVWHNPFKMSNHSDNERIRVIEAYAELLAGDSALQARLHELAGKTLVCWCSPKACHGQALLSALKTAT